MTAERLQKLLARAGLGSRREIEKWISDGHVKVNDRVAQLGDKAGPEDRITVRGRPVRLGAGGRVRVIAYHKPEGEVTTRKDPQGRPTVFDRLPTVKDGRWITIGRLDLNTSGLLLFTSDGALANALMHPSASVEREYAVRVLGPLNEARIRQLTGGVDLQDGMAHFESVVDAGGSGANHWYHVVLREGRKREVRRLFESQGVKVSRLMRIRYGPVRLGRGLKRGQWRELSPREIGALFAVAGIQRAKTPGRPRPPASAGRRGRR